MRLITSTSPIAGALALAIALSGAPAQAIGEGWIMDFEAAKTQAAAESKHILMDFTGSDWCGWCIRLDQEVFSQDVFKEDIPKHFVLLALDFPRDDEHLTEAIKAQNERLREEYGVRGFPTIILTDAQGVTYARTGYVDLGAEGYVAHLKTLKTNQAEAETLLKKAREDEELSEEDKARTLDQALDKVGSFEIAAARYAEVIEEILTLDKDDEWGLKSKYEQKKALAEIQPLIERRNYDEALPKIDAALSAYGVTGQIAQHLFFMKAIAQLNLGDLPTGQATMTQALEAAPEGERATQIGSILERIQEQLDAEAADEE